MKKQLLLGTALLAALSAFPQNGRVKAQPTGTIDLTQKTLSKLESLRNVESKTESANQSAQLNTASKAATSSNAINSWGIIAGSMNIFGTLTSESRPLQYNDNLNAVSFIHRKSKTYTPSPAPAANAESGSIVAEITNNWGVTWDSTCIWADNTNWARYPQGAIYNAPSTNTSNAMSAAYIVGCGPTTWATSSPLWGGNWFASKQLGQGNYNNAPSTTSLAMQFLPTVPTTTALGKSFFNNISFSSTDDGKVRSIGRLDGDDAQTTYDGINPRGATVVKGTFQSVVFTWTSDSVICGATIKTSNVRSMDLPPYMAWNEAGTVGYVVFIGSNAVETGTANSNIGWQPIVYKTTNSGNSWALINGIDFNSATFAPIKAHIPAIWSSTLASTPIIPHFNTSEGLGLTVDMNDKLHIVSTIVGSGSNHKDSLNTGYSFNTIEKYSWGHSPGDRPYVYDFIGDGTGAWTYITVDSLSSEGAGSRTTDPGYAENPWDPDPTNSGSKTVVTDSRIQAGRSADGKYVIYSWAESDTNFTNAGKKWNALPDLHVRCLEPANGYSLSPTELVITQSNQGVSSRAMCHYMSSTGSNGTVTTTGNTTRTLTVYMPFTVSNSLPYSQSTNNRHWYNTAELKFITKAAPTFTETSVDAISQNNNSANASVIYPNPAQNNATLLVSLKDNNKVNIMVMSITGQVVKSTTSQGQIGENNINFDLSGLASGIYMVNVKVGEGSSTKKLIIE